MTNRFRNDEYSFWDRDAVERTRTKRYSKTHCANGHEFIPENIKVRRNGERVCAICKREHNRISIAKRRAAERAARQAA
jgi:formylmethanofuran dehydrogenase subunit E